MKIKLNKLEFDVLGVPGPLRNALLTDPTIMQGVWRRVWEWDHVAQEGKLLTQVTEKKALPLPNGLSFFVPKKTADGSYAVNQGPSKLMAKRFVEQVGGKSVADVLGALQKIMGVPMRTIPYDQFAPLNPISSYAIRMHTEFNVVQLKEASRNLSGYLFIPGQVVFVAEVKDKGDEAAFDAMLAENPKLAQAQNAQIVPAQGKANQNARMIALAQRIGELRPLVEAATEGGKPLEDTNLRNAFGRTVSEWRAIAPKEQPTAKA
ncbi:hypothetical protein [Flavimaricola marinus]|uniref:Uncharacterized protein n=1 Tax=Flavimaricola marinus TaxID=1819565 RepID=A0A238LF00_9RHOB|nr:hypothetical protein [Flavimaricola marinus]SMY08143.1 hypothetical protein LOM8899_02292 [Flavimaricola marinus]